MAVDNSGVSDDFSPDLGLTKCQFGFTELSLRSLSYKPRRVTAL